ncbi:MAG TPA: hypothetical protein VFA76_02095 [Terriglobales bacterium]|nr:hypothetical protein [Terriglobales bacterium]
MMSLIELREQIAKLISGKLSLDDFEDWFAQRSWNMHKDSEIDAQRLAYAIELRLAEHDNGHLPEAELQRELRQLLESPVRISFGGPAPSVYIGTASTISGPLTQSSEWQIVGTSPSKASGSPSRH